MGEFNRPLRSFGKAYIIAVVVLGIVAYLGSRWLSTDLIALYPLILASLGVAYVFASILSWSGFGNLYRFSPTLFIGSPSYRQAMMHGDIFKEGRDRHALAVGLSLRSFSSLPAKTA